MSKVKKVNFTSQTTSSIARLSNLSLDKKEEEYLTKQFNETLKVVDKLDELRTQKTPETSQVTGLKNVFREDKVEKDRILSQEEALSGAKKIHQGYFVVNAIFDNES